LWRSFDWSNKIDDIRGKMGLERSERLDKSP